ncbi:MAG: quinoprotein relay system zinc metallohydrolase 2 [Gammaproteobacteria bacterium]|nr:quinoprotein relay system zinc metallohydrolase 2 [Gammaproteobacteria bacterium]MCY4210991.1 quinoprotein relay system zinc metallohydrolase 2 [Gammaproteobacteria bacterium]
MRAATFINIVFYLLSASGGHLHATEKHDKTFSLTEVSAGIYVHQGKHVGLEHDHSDDIANIGFIVGEQCIAVIDTGGSVAIGQALQKAMRSVSSLPVCYVINTHIHFDHVLGNAAFKAAEPVFVGHENLALEMAHNRAFFLSEFRANLGENPSAASIIGPDLTVANTLELDLGNRIITLRAYPPSHSHTDLSVYDHNTATLWLSDLLFVDRIPALDGSLKGWLETLDLLTAQPARRVIPGHGPVSLPWPDAADAQDTYLRMLLARTREEIAKGAFMEDIIETVGNTEKTQWLLHEENHRRNVTRAFTELEWE